MEDKEKPNFNQKTQVKRIRNARSEKAKAKRERSKNAKENRWN